MRRAISVTAMVCGLAILTAATLRLQVDPRRAIAAGGTALAAIAVGAMAVSWPDFGARPALRMVGLTVVLLALACDLAAWWGFRASAPEMEQRRERLKLIGQLSDAAEMNERIRATAEIETSLLLLGGALAVCGLSVAALRVRPSAEAHAPKQPMPVDRE